MLFINNWPFFHLFFKAIQGKKFFFTLFQNEKPPFYLIKKGDQKVETLRFFKRGQSVVQVKNWPFFHIFIFANIDQENVLQDILKRTNAFLRCKNKNFKNNKIKIFSKRVSPWFWSKIGYFPIFFLRQYRPVKYVLRYSRTKKRFARL